jgi:hypothetical protein
MRRARSIVGRVFTGCAVLAAAACERNVHLGAIGDGGATVLWRATFEPGNLSEWNGDGNGGVIVSNAPASPSATNAMAHSGSYAGLSSIAPALGMDSLNYFYRREPSPPEGYYSAWFYIPSTFAVRSWLSLHHFRASANAAGTNPFPTWDLNLVPMFGGSGLQAQVFDFVGVVNTPQSNPIPVPTDTWVHFEVFLRKASDLTGRVAVWQDGVLIVDRINVATAPSSWMEWSVGAATDNIAPSSAIVYIDDAAISLSRLGIVGN